MIPNAVSNIEKLLEVVQFWAHNQPTKQSNQSVCIVTPT